VPDLRLADEQVAQSVTLRQLLNHTSGWAGDLLPPPGWGDDALARALDALAEAPQELPLGHAASYSNSAFLLAGHLLARVHGTTFEQAVRELVLEPLGLTGSWYLPWEMAHRRHAVGHVVRDGVPEPVETYPIGRATGPAGGLWSTLRDQLTYARFHLGGSTAGTPPLSEGSRLLMQQQTVATRSTMAGVGLSWLLHRHADVRLVAHGGNISNLQTSTFVLAPDHDLAVVVMTNAKHGQAIGDAVLEWALQRYRGVGPRPLLPPVTFEAEELVGEYDRGAFAWHLSAEDGRLFVDLKVPAGVPEEIRLAFTAPPRELVAVGPDVFALAGSPTGPVLDVRRAQDGTVEGIVHGMRFARRASRCPVVAPPFPM
jgi:CubicO group peptidase (beta-lactamase class C family)